MSWKRWLDNEIKNFRLTWKELKIVAKDRDRDRWRNLVEALCSTRNKRT